MSAKKGRKAKVPTVPQDEGQKGASLDNMDSPNLSSIDKASFLEGLQLNYGNPLHSTAMEEDLNVLEEGQVNRERAERADIPQTLKTAAKQRGAAGKQKQTHEEKKAGRSTGGKVKARPEMEGETKKKKEAPRGGRGELDVERKESDPSVTLQKSHKPDPAASKVKRLVGKKPAKARTAGHTSAARPVKHQRVKTGKRRESESGSGMASGSQSQEESDTGTAQRRRKRVLSSDEELVDEDTSWNPSPKKPRMSRLSRGRKSLTDRSKSRKSLSGSASAGAERANTDKQRRKRHQGGTELEVVLDAFLDFCEQYRESVESKAVKQSIDCFSSNVKEQLLEKMSSHKELKVLKRENAKVGSLIRAKRQRLLDAKHELMRAERQEWLLQKEEADLKLRLADLRQGQAFLRDIRELNRQYLDFRRKHPREKETYGASSLAALLLETKHIQAAGQATTGWEDGRGRMQYAMNTHKYAQV